MDRLAKQQACQLFIEQEIEKGLKLGETKPQIGRRLAEWIERLFEAKVNPRSIERRAWRQEAETFVSNGGNGDNHSRKEEIQDEPKTHGGAREGAGRLPKIGPPAHGMQFARIAVMQLQQIKDNDTEKEQAFQHVLNYIQQRREE